MQTWFDYCLLGMRQSHHGNLENFTALENSKNLVEVNEVYKGGIIVSCLALINGARLVKADTMASSLGCAKP